MPEVDKYYQELVAQSQTVINIKAIRDSLVVLQAMLKKAIGIEMLNHPTAVASQVEGNLTKIAEAVGTITNTVINVIDSTANGTATNQTINTDINTINAAISNASVAYQNIIA